QGRAHGGDGDAVGGQAVHVDADVDGPLQAAVDRDVAHPRHALQEGPHRLVRDLRELADRPLGGEGDGDHGGAVVVELADGRRVEVAGQVGQGGGHPIAHVLGGGVDLAVEVEGDDHDRGALAGDRAQLLDPL